MASGTEKQTTSSSFSERKGNTLVNIFPFTMGVGTGNEGESQESEEDDDEQVDLDLKSASIVRPRRMRHTSKERLESWTNLVW